MSRKQKIIKKIVSNEMRADALENKETDEIQEQELEVSLRRKRERANIVPLSKLTRRALLFVGGNNCSQPHEEEQYWDWVEKVPKDTVFIFEGQNKEIYELPADSLWYMGNKSAREDRLLGTRRIKGGVK